MYSLKKTLIHGLCLTALLLMPVGLFSTEQTLPVTKAGFGIYVGPSWGGSSWGYRNYSYPRYYSSPYYYNYSTPYYYYGPSYYYWR